MLKWHQFVSSGCASDYLYVKENLTEELFPRSRSKNSVYFGRNTWIEMIDQSSFSSSFKDWRLANEAGKEILHPYISVAHTLFSPMFKIFFWSASEERKGSSAQERITVPMSSEFVAKMHAFSSLRLTLAIEVTSFMSSSTLLKRKTTLNALLRTDRKEKPLDYQQPHCISWRSPLYNRCLVWVWTGTGGC